METFLLLCTKSKKNPLANYQGAAVVVEAVGNDKNFDKNSLNLTNTSLRCGQLLNLT